MRACIQLYYGAEDTDDNQLIPQSQNSKPYGLCRLGLEGCSSDVGSLSPTIKFYKLHNNCAERRFVSYISVSSHLVIATGTKTDGTTTICTLFSSRRRSIIQPSPPVLCVRDMQRQHCRSISHQPIGI